MRIVKPDATIQRCDPLENNDICSDPSCEEWYQISDTIEVDINEMAEKWASTTKYKSFGDFLEQEVQTKLCQRPLGSKNAFGEGEKTWQHCEGL